MGYTEATSAQRIGERLIEAHHPHLKNKRIAYLLREKKQPRTLRRRMSTRAKKGPRAGKKQLMARTSLFNAKAKWAAESMMEGASPDFVIEIREEAWDRLSLEQQEALIDHELSHMGVDDEGCYMKHHDVAEFKAVIERHGLWDRDLEEFAETVRKRQLELSFDQNEELIARLKQDGLAEARRLAASPAHKWIAGRVAAGELTISTDGWIWDKDGVRETDAGVRVPFPDRKTVAAGN